MAHQNPCFGPLLGALALLAVVLAGCGVTPEDTE